jgi:hypothetical protein
MPWPARPSDPLAVWKLEAGDKAVLADALRLKSDLGEEVWPGFGKADIPVVVYDDNFEYLFGLPDPPASWGIVADDDDFGRPISAPARSQSFASAWAIGWESSPSAG